MAYITTNELQTHLYAENVDVISRQDDTIVQAAIDAAIAEAKGYLMAFDVKTEFEKTKTDPDTRNALLLIFIKDIAVWHFVNLCNAGTDLQLRQDRYERAIDWLKSVQKGNVTPDLPALPDETKTGIILFSSNPKRNNHF
ncbi:MAG TPA: DUF1320 family protein [Petrimonas sp.]|nr:DUF1320 family protein [Petrimonas sp.]